MLVRSRVLQGVYPGTCPLKHLYWWPGGGAGVCSHQVCIQHQTGRQESASMPEDCAAFQRHLARLEEGATGTNSAMANAKPSTCGGIVESWGTRIIQVGVDLSRALVQPPAGEGVRGVWTSVVGGLGWEALQFDTIHVWENTRLSLDSSSEAQTVVKFQPTGPLHEDYLAGFIAFNSWLQD